MKNCINCNELLNDDFKYCPKCGCKIVSNFREIIINLMIFILMLGITFLIALFIISYLMFK